jgi:hypothetical protein
MFVMTDRATINKRFAYKYEVNMTVYRNVLTNTEDLT